MKVLEVVGAAAIPVVARVSGPAVLTASLGSTVVVLETMQRLSQWQTNWVLYHSTAEALKHERLLFLACAGPYATADRQRVLAERLEGFTSQEHAKWTEDRDQAERGRPPTS